MNLKKRLRDLRGNRLNGKRLRLANGTRHCGQPNAYIGFEGVFTYKGDNWGVVDSDTSCLVIPLLHKCKFKIL